MNKWEFSGNGVVVPNLTFFRVNYSLDERNQEMCYKHIIINGADCIFLLSTTGEGYFVHQNPPLEQRLLEFSFRVLPPQIYIAVGCFGETAKEIIEDMNSKLEHTRINAFVITPPRKTHLKAAELAKLFIDVANNTEKPIFLYNNPENFCQNEIPLDSLQKFSGHENIIGLKDSSPSLDYKKKCAEFVSETFWVFTGKEGDLGNLLLEVPKSKRQFIGVVPSLGNLVNVYSQILENRTNDKTIKQLQMEINSWRNNFYDTSIAVGKAQRGLKISLEILYDKKVSSQPIVSPALKASVPPNFSQNASIWLNKLIKQGFITLFGG